MRSCALWFSAAPGAVASLDLALTLGSVPAVACDQDCGYGYGAAYDAPPAYAYAPPVAAFAPPPYSYYEPAYPLVIYKSYYVTRVNIFPHPHPNYAAYHHASPVLCHTRCWRARVSPCARTHFRPYHHVSYGPIAHAWRRW
ncbi:MAG: hypothetical protein J2P50_03415 [Hyphomicrobiaceae bacterium]|nr:hypothetical protein [Hyphomicrobiaceae bacterium]